MNTPTNEALLKKIDNNFKNVYKEYEFIYDF